MFSLILILQGQSRLLKHQLVTCADACNWISKQSITDTDFWQCLVYCYEQESELCCFDHSRLGTSEENW
jgi:hypothetical protein